MSWRERDEGERAFERNGPYSTRRNPYPEHGASYDQAQMHREWEDGYNYAERRDRDRREEERATEEREQRHQQWAENQRRETRMEELEREEYEEAQRENEADK